MKTKMEFFKNNSGIHLMATGNSEYSLCGDAWDGTEIVGEDQKCMVALSGFNKVTCKRCKKEISNVSYYLKMYQKDKEDKKKNKL
jgi:hypothetical protein